MPTIPDPQSQPDLEAISTSNRAIDRWTWHLFVCPICELYEDTADTPEATAACELGQELEFEAGRVQRALAAFRLVSPEQRRLLLEDLKALAWEGF